ncbi:cytidine deaminase [Entomospira culicis]|uniref:Cytidine deaminase n=1 Tax=Entomospira culicis TaxID=2719989 RepID=A0A968KV10_9SPIO|nr:cytidine deaminase [Entomospira culicis]NIZ18402.1 cytidine deaminase [Entomospira culicis]NIZ68618.1 cytidine deaminase [Entomospira culicis]WDI37218.1 cytidine deaminase [Entomospira culicis]WDI38846.1 cytidine deaminase [Entomospira culicis]
MLNLKTKEELIHHAVQASDKSYSPYSHFAVGAALLTNDETIITGANIENISFGLSNCAERSAIFSALSQGITEFKAIAIFSPQAKTPLQPCGACRQVLAEFVPESFPILLISQNKEVTETTLGALFPMSFQSLGDAKSHTSK